jgi:hypothetical protein
MSEKGKRHNKQKVRKARGKGRQVTIGTMTIPPTLTRGTQVGRPLSRSSKLYKRNFCVRIFLAAGSSNFANICVFTYQPFFFSTATSSAVSISNMLTSGPGAAFVNLCNTFSFYRVNTITFQCDSVISTTLAFPAWLVALLTTTTPANLGTSSSKATLTSIPNAVKYDPHDSASFTYRIPKATDIAQVGGNELAGGWIPVNYALVPGNYPTTVTPGIVAFANGDSGITIAPNTVSTEVYVNYNISFQLPE